MAADTLLAEAQDLQSEAVKLRRTLHEHPELGLDLPFTQERVLEALEGLPLTVSTGDSTTSVVATLDGARPGPTIILRGDMDALPMHEDTGLDFVSQHDDTMHACGHDLHTTMLVTAAKLLSSRQADLAGSVRFMFQPGEEGHHGAQYMLDEGLLDVAPDRPVTGAFAIHVFSVLPAGLIALRGGAQMASADQFLVTIHGRGGHAFGTPQRPRSHPHRVRDRAGSPGVLHADARRLRPRGDHRRAHLGRDHLQRHPRGRRDPGHQRAVSARTRQQLRDGLQRVADGIAAAHGTTATVELDPGYPVTVNDDGFAGFVLDVATDLVGDKAVARMPNPVMGSEDFSYVLERVPGAMAFLGAAPKGIDPWTAPPNHSNRVAFDEDVMARGSALYAAVALGHLDAPATTGA